ncbi:copper chaperone [Pseudoduganella armeniaca]|uniref:DUF2182 domain-containing protein n=1 Tax=Pseudoduganella armeniaca TaxID=2072590 RepID=A0A2R4CC22_9BURK|nr:DUF2182 domain-containing protein [Pseudoduganella armeniaca]AVR97183.1 hypothetical protein C9I28_17205 [Pseudoduganella armeniaca]
MALSNVLRRLRRGPWPLLFALAAVGMFATASSASGPDGLGDICATAGFAPALSSWSSAFAAALARPGSWAAMLLAMMPPLLAPALAHVWYSSRPRRRMRAVLWFVAGYGAVWMAAGPCFTAVAAVLLRAVPAAAFPAVLAGALAWSASPWQRRVLARGHRLQPIGLFGIDADRDCALFGAGHAPWCVAACGPWMMVPLVSGTWHFPVMAGTALLLWAERLAPHGQATGGWRLPLPIRCCLAPFIHHRRKTSWAGKCALPSASVR